MQKVRDVYILQTFQNITIPLLSSISCHESLLRIRIYLAVRSCPQSIKGIAKIIILFASLAALYRSKEGRNRGKVTSIVTARHYRLYRLTW